MADRLFIIKGKGSLVNPGLGLPRYDLDTVRKVVGNIHRDNIVGYNVYRVRIPHLFTDASPDSCVWKYDSNEIEFHVANTRSAKRAFTDCLRITRGHLDGHFVLAVFEIDGDVDRRESQLFKNVTEAFAGDRIPVSIEFVAAP